MADQCYSRPRKGTGLEYFMSMRCGVSRRAFSAGWDLRPQATSVLYRETVVWIIVEYLVLGCIPLVGEHPGLEMVGAVGGWPMMEGSKIA